MLVQNKSFNGTTTVPIETDLFDKRKVFVEGEICMALANEFLKQIMYLVLKEPEKPIQLYINSNGGEIDAGMKMIEIVSNCPCKINAYCFGNAYSMAAILFESVNGERNMLSSSKIMLHQPLITRMEYKNAGEVTEIAKHLQKANEKLLEIVSKRSGISLSRLKKETIKDRYFDANEALQFNLADKVVDFSNCII